MVHNGDLRQSRQSVSKLRKKECGKGIVGGNAAQHPLGDYYSFVKVSPCLDLHRLFGSAQEERYARAIAGGS
ncbi:hypothetical protein GCM10010869_04630 [Mesorhizobium tianshanense]|nr:hypothetical protein GCM10010869_04630 [Mesorhizobium tianshanense]